jgi:hypothetical protein
MLGKSLDKLDATAAPVDAAVADLRIFIPPPSPLENGNE